MWRQLYIEAIVYEDAGKLRVLSNSHNWSNALPKTLAALDISWQAFVNNVIIDAID